MPKNTSEFYESSNNQRFDVQKHSKLTVSYWLKGGGGGTDLTISASRKKIVKLLSGMQFGVNSVPVHKDRIIDVAGEIVDLTHEVRNDGTVMALGNGGGSQIPGTIPTGSAYQIRNGASVCFDMETGYSLTGVNPEWQADEYKIIGMAMGDVSQGMQMFPMKFGSPASPGGTVNRMAVLQGTLYKGKSTGASLLKPINAQKLIDGDEFIIKWGFDRSITVWDHLMPYEDDYIDGHVKVIVSQEPTSGLWVINNPACSPGGIQLKDFISDQAPIFEGQ